MSVIVSHITAGLGVNWNCTRRVTSSTRLLRALLPPTTSLRLASKPSLQVLAKKLQVPSGVLLLIFSLGKVRVERPVSLDAQIWLVITMQGYNLSPQPLHET